ncbi:MAG: hypothetical protein R3C49_15650 [Planctomycetaceae bacterium]
MESSHAQPSTTSRQRWRRAIVTSTALSGILVTTIGLLPSAVMNSSWRDSLLNARLEKAGLHAVSESGSGGWLTAIRFDNVTISDPEGEVTCRIRSIQTSKSLLSLLTGRHAGTFTVVEPRLSISLDDQGRLPLEFPEMTQTTKKSKAVPPPLDFSVQSGSVTLSVPWREIPIVDVDDLNVQGRIQQEASGRWLTIDGMTVLDHEQLSDLHTQQNLALIAPVFAQTTELNGTVSLFVEPIRVQLDAEEKSFPVVHGQAVFHDVTARLKQEWAIQVSQLIGQVSGRDVPSRLQVMRDSAVQFRVDQQGVYHEGLALLLPDLAGQMLISSSGTVGLDERLDLVFSLQPPQVNSPNPVLAGIAKMLSAPVQMRVQGTVSEPKMMNPPGMSVVDQLARNVSPENGSQPPPPVGRAVMDLISSAASNPAGAGPNPAASEAITGGILNIIRAAKEAKANAPPKEPGPRRPRKRDRP